MSGSVSCIREGSVGSWMGVCSGETYAFLFGPAVSCLMWLLSATGRKGKGPFLISSVRFVDMGLQFVRKHLFHAARLYAPSCACTLPHSTGRRFPSVVDMQCFVRVEDIHGSKPSPTCSRSLFCEIDIA